MQPLASKEKIRQHFREARKHLTIEEQARMNAGLLLQLEKAVPQSPEVMMTFSSLPEWGEPDAALLTQFLQSRYPKLQVTYPKILDDAGNMEAFLPMPGSAMIPGRWNIPEPERGEIVDPKQLELVLVPLLAFDLNGHRVGYGKGYYDCFLQRCRPDVIRLGVSFFEPIGHIEDTGYFDVPLSRCITPVRLYEF
ncbi:MAG: 5-formyltetrahydrofolate cyclo-ligase [Chitinophagaceae bacterium]|nr:5-formyltetrahydrofolate cyclo-ligase [Chitinophagaceae bacterium]